LLRADTGTAVVNNPETSSNFATRIAWVFVNIITPSSNQHLNSGMVLTSFSAPHRNCGEPGQHLYTPEDAEE
jgi:hypothetical protein